MQIALLGTGNMGTAIGQRLLQAGHGLRAWNRTLRKAEPLEKAGASLHRTAREAVQGAELVVSSLADDAAVRSALSGGPDGAIEGMAAQAVHISMSTISPVLAAELDDTHRQRDQRFVSAPVLGRPDVAARGELVVLTAGPADALARCAAVFSAVGRETQHIGEQPSQANVVKLAFNFTLVSMMESLGEAFALTERNGIRNERMLDVFNSVYKSPVIAGYGSLIAREAFEPAGMRMPVGQKDIREVLRAAESAQLAMPIASVLRDRFLVALEEGRGEQDWSAIARAGRKKPQR